MITVRKAEERGHFNFGWLNTYHTFSFGEYHDEAHKGFRNLRVINEDWIQPGQGFPTHSHWNMEIITYVVEGALAHQDSMGNGSTIFPNDLQYMSAGTGVQHSEYNHPKETATHILQIWILTREKGLAPLYGQKTFPREEKKGKLRLVASPSGAEDSVQIRQDVHVYAAILEQDHALTTTLPQGRFGWVQVVSGVLSLNGVLLKAGDGAQIEEEIQLEWIGKEKENEFLFFDLN